MANIKKIKIGDVTYDIMIDDKYIFKDMGTFSRITDDIFLNACNEMHGDSSTGYEGYYRAFIGKGPIEVYNFPIDYTKDKWIQIIRSPYRWDGRNFNITEELKYRTLYRVHENGKWGNWYDSDEELKEEVKNELRNSYVWDSKSNLNNFTTQGEYNISGTRQNANDNMPITNNGNIEGKLDVMSNNNVISQTLTLLNVNGGDSNVYTRTKQNNQWKPWGKLQTNIEVGMVNQTQMDDLVDNGIYSGVFENKGNLETFVLIVINNYAVAESSGDKGKQSICQLKYGLSLYDSVGNLGGMTLQTRKRDAFGFWGAWKTIYDMNDI